MPRKNNKCYIMFFLYRCFTYISLCSVTKCKIWILSEFYHLTTNSQQPIEQQDDCNNSHHDSGVVFSERGPESHHQHWAREAEGHHNREPSEPLVWENPQDLLLKCETYYSHVLLFLWLSKKDYQNGYADDRNQTKGTQKCKVLF